MDGEGGKTSVRGLAEEAPFSCKEINAMVDVGELARRVRPLNVVKG